MIHIQLKPLGFIDSIVFMYVLGALLPISKATSENKSESLVLSISKKSKPLDSFKPSS